MRGLSIPCWLVALFSMHVAVALLTSHKPIHVGTRQRRGKLMKRNMFSGIVEDIGEVVDLKVNPAMKMWDGSLSDGVELTVRSTKAVEEAYIGCSIAVNGVCLTATAYDHEQFTVGLAPETLRRSNLGSLTPGSKVNIERALRADGRNSGHFVQGHIDNTALIVNKWTEGDSLWVKLAVPPNLIKYIVPKGFIALDGTSLTVCDVDTIASTFTIMMVAHTQQSVILPSKSIGDRVNIEVDVLGKLVDASVQASLAQLQAQIDALRGETQALQAQLHRQQQQPQSPQ